ncbi:MAG: chemotaxis protein CheW [Acidimicrobiales bacterium]
MTTPTLAGERQLCTFRVEELYLGIDVLSVQEVLYHNEITEVPHSPPGVTGLINLRGQIATTIDLATRLGVPPRTIDATPVHVVVRYHGEPVSLLVAEIGDVMTVDADAYEQPPETVAGSARELLTGAYKLDDGLLLTLDIDRVIAISADDS